MAVPSILSFGSYTEFEHRTLSLLLILNGIFSPGCSLVLGINCWLTLQSYTPRTPLDYEGCAWQVPVEMNRSGLDGMDGVAESTPFYCSS